MKTSNEAVLPDHLGGHMNKVHTDRGTLEFLKKEYGIQTMVDVGCGPGDMVEIANNKGIRAVGVDGDFTLDFGNTPVILHDFTTGPVPLWQIPSSPIERDPMQTVPWYHGAVFDLGWSVEFLEHVEERYLPNFMDVFWRCKYVVCTAAPPIENDHGHHHVNCQPIEYWIEKFDSYGFDFDKKVTNDIRNMHSNMIKPFMQRNGMFFVKRKSA